MQTTTNQLVIDNQITVENNTVPTVHFSNLIIINDHDESYFYGSYRNIDYSIEKETMNIYCKNNDTNDWELIQNPFVFLTEDIQKDILIKNACFNTFMLNQQIIELNTEISRLHTQELGPLKCALEQANFTIERFIHKKGGREQTVHDLHRAQSKIEEQRIYIMKLKNQLNGKDIKIDNENNQQIEELKMKYNLQIQQFETQLLEKNTKLNEIQSNFDSLNKSFNELQSKLSNFDELSEFKSKYLTLKDELVSKNEIIQNMNIKLNEFETIQESSLKSTTELKKNIKTLEKTIHDLRFDTSKDAEIQNLRQRISQLDQDKIQLKNSIINQVREQVIEKTNSIQKEMEKYRALANEKDRELTKLRQENKKLSKSFNEMDSDNTLLKNTIKSVQQESKIEIDRLNQQLTEKTTQFNTMNDKNMKIEKQFRKALEDLQKSKSDIDSLEKNYISVVSNYDEENNKLRYEIKSCREKVKLYHEVSNRSVDQLKAVIRREKILKNALARYENKPTEEESHENITHVIENIVRNSVETYNRSLQHDVSNELPPQVEVN